MRRCLAALLVVAGCSSPSVEQFAGTTPVFDPLVFFTGHVTSWGVIEDRGAAPTSQITTDCRGVLESPDTLRMDQQLTEGGKTRTRTWRLRRVTPTHFEATADDIVGGASGYVAGRVFHWRYTLALEPGNSLKNVGFDQWMYFEEDGSMLNRATISKLGVTLAHVTEHFRHV